MCLYLYHFFHLSAYIKWFVCLIRFLAVLFFCAFPGYVALSGFFWGCMLYLAGLDASSPRSPSVLILLVLADLDGSISLWGISILAVKSRLTGSPENVIYCVGISPIMSARPPAHGDFGPLLIAFD